MKKTILFLAAAVFIFALGGFAQPRDQTPPPPKPVAVAPSTAPAPIFQAVPHPGQSAMIPHPAPAATTPAPPAQAVAHPVKPVPAPHKAPVAATAPAAEIPAIAHPASGLTPHSVTTTMAPPAAIAQAAPSAPMTPALAQATIPHPANVALAPHPAVPAAVAPSTPGVPVALAVEQTPPPKEAAAPRTVAHSPDQAQTAPPARAVAGMRTEIIKFKYAELFAVNSLLNAYKSVYGRVSITSQSDKTIVVTDTPEIVEKMISLVRDIDVKPVEIQFTVQLVQGNEAEGPGDESLKNDPLIRELRGVLRYKSFSLLDGTLMRVIDGIESETKFGPKGEYALRLEPKYVKDGAAETIQTRIQLRKPEWINQKITHTEKKEETQSMQMYYNNLIQTSLQLKAGEKTVVGVSKSDADKGLILILSAKIIR